MRLRSKRWAGPFIEKHSDLIFSADQARASNGKWSKIFNNDYPIFLEIGCGKGQFIFENAIRHEKINYIGLELQPTAVAIAAKNAVESVQKPKNLKFILGDGADLSNYFSDGEIERIFLNHSDPWPKSRHEKRRLTYRTFLRSYRKILCQNGTLELKTDNLGLFEYSLASFSDFGLNWSKDKISYDLHHELQKKPDNVQSEYEKKFADMGQREFWVEVSF